MPTRRQILAGAAATTLVGSCADFRFYRPLGPMVAPGTLTQTRSLRLVAAERPTALPCFGGATLPLWTFAEGAWPPVIRVELGDRLVTTLENRLPRAEEHTSVHWHGVRVPNRQDGVPYLVQPPVPPGAGFRYAFNPPDAGTFFFHTHCNTVEQLGRGLAGVLIVDGDTTEPYDADLLLVIHDWRIEPGTDRFAAFATARGSARGGTYGPLRSVNGAIDPEIALPASGDCRLRLINIDPTRIMQIGVEGAEAAIVAIDGIALPPLTLTEWPMGPANRLELVLRAPPPGGVARLVDTAAGERVELARLVGQGTPRRASGFDPAPLRTTRIPEPNLVRAQALEFRLQAADGGVAVSSAGDPKAGPLGPICRSSRTLWAINGRAWPDRADRLPPPIAVLELGRTYRFTLKNETVFGHPLHIHGHYFTFLGSDHNDRPPHRTDTLLLRPGEQAEVAFVADNPGNWMLHCHVIEHQENGMMSYLSVA
jgi:FtsP/CotA-like multicopper oxidase with cupredoxin domain